MTENNGSATARIIRVCRITDSRKGLLLSAVIAWMNFAFLYWAVVAESDLGMLVGLSLFGVSCGMAAYFG